MCYRWVIAGLDQPITLMTVRVMGSSQLGQGQKADASAGALAVWAPLLAAHGWRLVGLTEE